MSAAAVGDRVIGVTPCTGVRLPPVDRGDRFIPSPQQVHALAAALPAHLRAAVYLAAGCGLRASETFGLELGHVHFLRREVTVRQQMATRPHHGPYLSPPRTVTSAVRNGWRHLAEPFCTQVLPADQERKGSRRSAGLHIR